MEAFNPLKDSSSTGEELEEVKKSEEEEERSDQETASLVEEDRSGEVAAAEEEDRFSYFKKGFTTEIYKIEIRNLPIFVGFKVRTSSQGGSLVWVSLSLSLSLSAATEEAAEESKAGPC